MQKPQKPKMFTEEEVNRREGEAYNRGNNAGMYSHRHLGFTDGFEAAKLDTFRHLALEGKAFIVCPPVTHFVLPLVEARLKALGMDLEKKEVE